MKRMDVDVSWLPPDTARVISTLVHDLLARHPQLSGFQLAGSYWNRMSQLPGADIDLRRYGKVDAAKEDDRVAANAVSFRYRGRLIDLAEWMFGDVGKPATLSLQASVSFVRAPILWERGHTLRTARRSILRQLQRPHWRRQAVDAAFARCLSRLSELLVADRHVGSLFTSYVPLTRFRYFTHVLYTLVDEMAGLLSVLDFRPPSLSRKAILEIQDCLSAVGSGDLVQRADAATGCERFDSSVAASWQRTLDEAYEAVSGITARALVKRRYYTTAVEAFARARRHRAMALPVVRGLEECYRACEFIPPRWLAVTLSTNRRSQANYRHARVFIDSTANRVISELGFDPPLIGRRLNEALSVIRALQRRRDHLLTHFDRRFAESYESLTQQSRWNGHEGLLSASGCAT